MTEFIYKLLLGKKELHGTTVRQRIGSRISIMGIAVNILLFVGKYTVGVLSGMISVTGDAINNLSDAASSVVSLVSFKLSSKPSDREHP